MSYRQSIASRFAVSVAIAAVSFAGLTGCVSRSESDVVVYSALDQEFAMPILDAFERARDHETGVVPKFDVESTKTVGLANLIIWQQ